MTTSEVLLDLLHSYPTDGTYKYDWPRDSSFSGVTEDLFYKGELIAAAREDKATYCCGYTFELFFKTMLKLSKDLGSIKEIKQIKANFFIAGRDLRGPVAALVSRGLAEEVELKDAKAGDLAQLWRARVGTKPVIAGKYTSGHSVTILNTVDNGIHYHSTQKSTNGIGNRTEYFTGNNPIVDTFIARLK